MSENALYFTVVSRRSPDRADLFAWREGVPCNPFSYERLLTRKRTSLTWVPAAQKPAAGGGGPEDGAASRPVWCSDNLC